MDPLFSHAFFRFFFDGLEKKTFCRFVRAATMQVPSSFVVKSSVLAIGPRLHSRLTSWTQRRTSVGRRPSATTVRVLRESDTLVFQAGEFIRHSCRSRWQQQQQARCPRWRRHATASAASSSVVAPSTLTGTCDYACTCICSTANKGGVAVGDHLVPCTVATAQPRREAVAPPKPE